MVHVESKLNAIQIQELINVFNRNRLTENEYLIYWLKFPLRKLEPKFLTNFNIIPFGLETETPPWYKAICKLIPMINKFWPHSRIYSKMTTKTIYSKLKEQFELKSSFEINNPQFEWTNLFEKKLDPKLNSKAISLNYKIALNGLPTLDKFKNFRNRCFICKNKKESIHHLLYECEITRGFLLELWADIHKNETKTLTSKTLLFNFECNQDEKKYLSAYKSTVWRFREQSKFSKSRLSLTTLKRIFITELNHFNL